MKISTPLVIGAVAVVGTAAYFAVSASKLSEKMIVTVGAKLDKLDITGAYLSMTVTLKNPTNGTARIKYPLLSLMVGETVIASSDLGGADIQIPQYGQNSFVIPIRIPTLALAPIAADMYRLFTGKVDQVTIKVKTTTTAFVPLIPAGMPINEVTEIPIRLKKQSTVNGIDRRAYLLDKYRTPATMAVMPGRTTPSQYQGRRTA